METCILSWLLDQKVDRNMLNNHKSILPNILVCTSLTELQENPNQSKIRRILENEISLVEEYLTPQVYSILVKLKEKTNNGATLKYACMKCNIVFGDNDRAWYCRRCLLWFHQDCEEAGTEALKFCIDCYAQET